MMSYHDLKTYGLYMERGNSALLSISNQFFSKFFTYYSTITRNSGLKIHMHALVFWVRYACAFIFISLKKKIRWRFFLLTNHYTFKNFRRALVSGKLGLVRKYINYLRSCIPFKISFGTYTYNIFICSSSSP